MLIILQEKANNHDGKTLTGGIHWQCGTTHSLDGGEAEGLDEWDINNSGGGAQAPTG